MSTRPRTPANVGASSIKSEQTGTLDAIQELVRAMVCAVCGGSLMPRRPEASTRWEARCLRASMAHTGMDPKENADG